MASKPTSATAPVRRPSGGDDGDEPVDESTTDVVVLDENAEEVLVRLDVVLAEADEALADGDLGLYQEKVEEAEQLIDEAVERLGLDVAVEYQSGCRRRRPTDDDGETGTRDRDGIVADDDAAARTIADQVSGAGSPESIGEFGEVLAELDRVARLFVGEALLPAGDVVEPGGQLVDHLARIGASARHDRGRR